MEKVCLSRGVFCLRGFSRTGRAISLSRAGVEWAASKAGGLAVFGGSFMRGLRNYSPGTYGGGKF